MASITHGIEVLEQATPMSVPKTAGTIQAFIGTAPVNMVEDPESVTNTPIYCASPAEAIQMLGYCPDTRFTLNQCLYANKDLYALKPFIFINVLDIKKHKKAFDEQTITVNDMTANLPLTGVIRSSLTVKTAGEDSKTLAADTDYIAMFDDADGTLNISLVAEGVGADATALTVTGEALDPDPDHVPTADVIGTVNVSTGAETGMECVRQIYPKFGVIPTLISAPGFSHIPEVGIALAAKAARINGVFKGFALIDLDTEECRKYTDCKTTKEDSGFISEFTVPVWPYFNVGSSLRFAPTAVASAAITDLDLKNGDIPYESPSNKTIPITGTCLRDGTEILLDQDQANLLNQNGIMTALNMNGRRLWGNYTAAYPSSSDAKDIWIPVRRMFNWVNNSFILTFMDKVDDPMNVRLIEDVVNTANNQYQAMAPTAWAAASVEYLADDNPTTLIIAGHIIFRIHIAPYTPAQVITAITDYDIQSLTAALAAAA